MLLLLMWQVVEAGVAATPAAVVTVMATTALDSEAGVTRATVATDPAAVVVALLVALIIRTQAPAAAIVGVAAAALVLVAATLAADHGATVTTGDSSPT